MEVKYETAHENFGNFFYKDQLKFQISNIKENCDNL